MNITSNNISTAKDIKTQLRKFLNNLIKTKVRLQYIKLNVTLTYLKDSELKTDIPLCKDYLINIRSKYKKEQNYFIKDIGETFDELLKNEITQLLYVDIKYTKVNKKDVENFQLVENPAIDLLKVGAINEE